MSVSIEWIAMIFGTEIGGPRQINPKDSGDPLTDIYSMNSHSVLHRHSWSPEDKVQ